MTKAPAHVWALVAFGLLAVGSSPILIRLAGDAPALTLAAWRTMAVTAVFAPIAAARSRDEIAAFSLRDWTLALGAGVLLPWSAGVLLLSSADVLALGAGVASGAGVLVLSSAVVLVLGGDAAC